MKSEDKKRQQQNLNESHRKSLEAWFNEKRWLKAFPILANSDPSSNISLRVLEYLTDPTFVDACRRENVPMSYYIEKADGSGRCLFDLPSQLLALQNSRSKKFMDAFKRWNHDLENGGRFKFGVANKVVETNVAQLQYFRFLIENHVLDWFHKHENRLLDIKNACRVQQRKKRRESSDAASDVDDETAAASAAAAASEPKRRKSMSVTTNMTPLVGVNLEIS